MKKEEIVIKYEEALSNHMRNNVEEAIHSFIQEKEGYAITLFPQALNPFLKALESMGAWKKALVLPYCDTKNKPLYVIIKISGEREIVSVTLEG